jgi:hypothetical protein
MRKTLWLLLVGPLVFAFEPKTFQWTPPTEYEDGSALVNSDIDEYRIYCNEQLIAVVENVNNTNSWTSGNFSPGSYSCNATAVVGTEESSPSNTITFFVSPPIPKAPVGLVVAFDS